MREKNEIHYMMEIHEGKVYDRKIRDGKIHERTSMTEKV